MAKVAQWTLLYYAATTIAAVVLGIVLVNVVQPGRGSPLDGDVTSCAGGQVMAYSPFCCSPRACSSKTVLT